MPKQRKYRDKDWLEHQYIDCQLSQAQIAKLCNTGQSTISIWMKKHGIAARTDSEALVIRRANHPTWNQSHSEAIKKYHQKGHYDKAIKAMLEAREQWEPDDEFRQGCAERTKIRWARGDFDDNAEIIKTLWEQGHYDHIHESEKFLEAARQTMTGFHEEEKIWTPERRRQQSETMKRLHAEGKFSDIMQRDEYRQTISKAVKAAWDDGKMDNRKVRTNSPTWIEQAVIEGLDQMDIEHISQYKPEDCRYVFDEFIPPNILLELNGDYWHSFPEAKQRDEDKKQWAIANGYRFMTIWEHELEKENPETILAQRLD